MTEATSYWDWIISEWQDFYLRHIDTPNEQKHQEALDLAISQGRRIKTLTEATGYPVDREWQQDERQADAKRAV